MIIKNIIPSTHTYTHTPGMQSRCGKVEPNYPAVHHSSGPPSVSEFYFLSEAGAAPLTRPVSQVDVNRKEQAEFECRALAFSR